MVGLKNIIGTYSRASLAHTEMGSRHMGQFTRKISKTGRRSIKRATAFQLARLLSLVILVVTLLKAFIELVSAILTLAK